MLIGTRGASLLAQFIEIGKAVHSSTGLMNQSQRIKEKGNCFCMGVGDLSTVFEAGVG